MINYPSIEEIDAAYDNLPDDLQEAIVNANIGAHLAEMMQRYGVTVGQINIIETLVNMTLVGLYTSDEFINHAADVVTLDELTLANFINDINDKVFNRVREELALIQQLHQDQKELEAEATAPVAPTNVPTARTGVSTPNFTLAEIKSAIAPSAADMPIPVPKPHPAQARMQKTMRKTPQTTGTKYQAGVDPYLEPIS